MGNFVNGVKAWIAAHRKTLAALAAPVVVVVDDVVTGTPQNWPVFIAAVLVALGVYAVPNSSPTPPQIQEIK